MRITINNKIKISEPEEKLKNILIELLHHVNPVYTEAEKMGLNTYKIEKFINYFEFDASGSLYIPRGMRQKLFKLLNEFNFSYKLKDKRKLNFIDDYIDSSKIKYRPYQKPALDKLLANGPEGILVAPAGSGKTVMGLSLVPITLQNTLWLTHTDRLFKQFDERFNEFIPGLNENAIGRIGAGKWTVGKVVTISMVQTLIRNIDRLIELRDTFGMIIIDEVHHSPASTFYKVISQLNPYFMYGLTATAYRRDGLENLMFQSIGDIGAIIPKEEVAKYNGIILPLVLYCPISYGSRVDINNVSIIFKEHIIFNNRRNHKIKNDVVAEARKGNFCIVSSGRKTHCEELYEIIKKDWKQTGIATGKYSKKIIDAQIEAFNNKEITVLITTPELLGEGFDVDFLNRLFIATSFRTESRVEQLVGRIQRFHPNKKNAIVYDYVDENIGVFKNQFYSKYGKCRSNVYQRLGLKVIDFADYHI